MVMADEGNSWIYKNKDHGMMSAAASLGLSLLWDIDVGLSHIDKYTYSSEEHIKVSIFFNSTLRILLNNTQAGALFATGMLNAGVRSDADYALSLLTDYTDNKSVPLRTASFMGLGLAYAGTHREDILSLLLPFVADDGSSMEIASLAALALGFIFVGAKNGDISETILQTLMEKFERGDKSLNEKWARFMALALGLNYLGLSFITSVLSEILIAFVVQVTRMPQMLPLRLSKPLTTQSPRLPKFWLRHARSPVPEMS